METWAFGWAFRNFFAELLMPPGIWLACILLAVFLLNGRTKLQKSVICFAAFLIWVCSTPFFAACLVKVSDSWMNWPMPFVIESYQHNIKNQATSKAIVILGGGRRKGAIESPQYQNQDLSSESFERLRMGAILSHSLKIPILLTGGAPDKTSSNDLPEAEVMAIILEKEFHLKAKWLENQSHTTQENAQFTSEILKRESIQEIYLVTHFWHIPRAQKIFEKYDFKVIPVPHGYFELDRSNPLDFYPSGVAINRVRQVWHEILGVAWYALKY